MYYHSEYTFLYTCYCYLPWNWWLIFRLCLFSTFGWLFRPLNWHYCLPIKQCVLIIYLHVGIHEVDVAWYNSIIHRYICIIRIYHEQIWKHWPLLLDIITHLSNHYTSASQAHGYECPRDGSPHVLMQWELWT